MSGDVFAQDQSNRTEHLCAIDGCDGEFYARRLCRPHYMRHHRTGSPTPPRRHAASTRRWPKLVHP